MPASKGNILREGLEAIIVFCVFIVIFWLKDLINVSLWADSHTLARAVGLGTFVVATLCLLFVMEIIVRRRSLSVVGFRLPINKRVLLIFTGIATLLLVTGIVVHSIYNIQYYYFNQYFISAVLLGPLVEEIAFRGLIQTRLEASFGITKSWILTSLLFGFYHYVAWFLIQGQTFTTDSVIPLTYTVVFGVAAGIFYAKTRSLLPPFLLHAINNAIAFL